MTHRPLAILAALALLAALPAHAERADPDALGASAPSDRVMQQNAVTVRQIGLTSGILEKAEELRGDAVIAEDGRALGEVAAVVGSASGQGRYLVIDTDASGMPFLPVPEHQFLRVAQDRLQLRTADAKLAEAPRFAQSDFAAGPDGWPLALETWWRELLQQDAERPRPASVSGSAARQGYRPPPPGAAAPGPEAYEPASYGTGMSSSVSR